MWRVLLALPLVIAACGPDETISGYADPAATYGLVQMNGADFDATATIRFPAKGAVQGQGPCNAYLASQSAPYPWFDLGPVQATRMACPALGDETRFFENLVQMTLAEVSGDVLILSNDAGDQMVFQARD
ncbi:META domain-containing protein [Pseudaestuariivita rosea]|uniref:META domain-containing protein n=1 Tax=Pseudaestuariivita rosea TaxID=2763263 RepID=UPI001ABA3A78|nr:META domain-containing protein [Pseudaestuariivita rosea]